MQTALPQTGRLSRSFSSLMSVTKLLDKLRPSSSSPSAVELSHFFLKGGLGCRPFAVTGREAHSFATNPALSLSAAFGPRTSLSFSKGGPSRGEDGVEAIQALVFQLRKLGKRNEAARLETQLLRLTSGSAAAIF